MQIISLNIEETVIFSIINIEETVILCAINIEETEQCCAGGIYSGERAFETLKYWKEKSLIRN